MLRISSMVDLARFGVLWPVSYRPAMTYAQELPVQDTRDFEKHQSRPSHCWNTVPEVEPRVMTPQATSLSRGWEHNKN